MKKAVIDIGTNSVKFCLAEKIKKDMLVFIKDVSEISKLGEGLNISGEIGHVPLERNAQIVAGFVLEAREAGAEEIVAAGTMALRTAKNSSAFIKRVRELTGIDVKILSWEEEAELSYSAVIFTIPGAANGSLVMFDTGGGSTEFVLSEEGVIKNKFSLNIGAVRITEQYFSKMPVPEELLLEVQSEIQGELAAGLVSVAPKLLVGIGGNVTSMAAVRQSMAVYHTGAIHGSKLTLSDVDAQIACYASKTLEERHKIVGLEPKRADVILAGACIVKAVMELFGVSEITVSDRSLRHGLMYRLFDIEL
ncbi:MAG: Ppx/GppA family phosphatase [Synergistaceae bacterium]|nr:Ppx/GppA family phosphatase [Synergistaceae bacterium]